MTFSIDGEPRELVLRGLVLHEGEELPVRFELPRSVELGRIDAPPAEGAARPMAGAGIGDVRIVETDRPHGATPRGGAADAPRFDGIYYSGEGRSI